VPNKSAATPRRPKSPARHARKPESHRVARGIALTMTALLALGATGGATAYSRLQGNIQAVDVTALLPSARPTVPPPADPSAGKPLNILLMGSDNRAGANAKIAGEVAGMRSDTTIVLHLSANRTRVELVSIPRDTLVKIPVCLRSDGSKSTPRTGMFNSAFAIGASAGKVSDAAACAMNTVETNTHVFLNGYVVIDMTGFTRMIDALGGVPICIQNDMDSPAAGLHVKAGAQTLNGTTALAFARARKGKGLGDGSDTGRIVRQQQLLAATVRMVQSKNLLTDGPALLKFLSAATSSITANPELASISHLTGLAYSLRGTGTVTFMTIPFGPAPSDPNRVVMTPAADAVWANLIADKPISPAKPAAPAVPAGTATAPGSTTPTSPTTPTPTAPVVTAPVVTGGATASVVCG
jgi:LCP family protein required for cell wall assembly